MSFNKNNGILWVKIGNDTRMMVLSTIARLSKNHKMDIKLITKIPKEYWERSKSIENNCTKMRREDPELRTQVWLGYEDLELMTKHKKDMFWQTTPLDAFGPIEPPCFSSSTPVNTPEGRQKKRGPSSPLISDISKQHKGSASPQPLT